MGKGLMMKYFVLKPKGDDDYAIASRAAMMAYAAVIRELNPTLAEELRDWVLGITNPAATASKEKE